MSEPRPIGRVTDVIFRIGLIVKGVDSAFEVVGGLLLAMPIRLSRALLVLGQHEAYRHHEVLAGRLDRLADSVLEHSSMGEAAYLMVHGLAKVVLIAAIFRGKQWGYTGLIGVLSFFTLIELTRAIAAHEVVTAALGLFDIVMVILIAKEYRAHFGKTEAPSR